MGSASSRRRSGIVGIVAPLEPRGLDHHLDDFVLRLRAVAEIPQPQSVVAIDRLDHIGAGVELHAHLAEIVAEQAADLPAEQDIVEAMGFGGKQRAAFIHEAVRIGVVGIEQGARQPRHQGRRVDHARGFGDVKGRPQTAQTRKGAHGQGFDARVFDEPDQRHLQRLQRSDRKSGARQRHMRGRVRDAGAKQLRQRRLGHAAKYRRNAHDPAGDVDAPGKLPAGRRDRAAQDRRPAPQRRRVSLQDPFAAGEGQRAGRLLQHLRGKPVFQRKEGAPARAVAAGEFEPGGDEGLEA